MKSRTAIVIGSGFGGLAMALRLQALGFSVTIYEKNAQPGGHASQLKKKGFIFDMGPSIVTAPYLVEELFELHGRKLADYCTLQKVLPYYRVIFDEGSVFDYSGDEEEMKNQLANFNAADGEAYEKFMDYSQKLHDFVMEGTAGRHPFHSFKEFRKLLPFITRNKNFLSSYQVVSQFFKDERSRFIFSFHPLFLGGNPFVAPSLLLMIPYLEKRDEVWFPEGGMYELVKALVKLFKENGGRLVTEAPVSQLLVEKKKVLGVEVHGKEKKADVVISNAHFAHTYKDLVDEANRRTWSDRKIDKFDYSMSCVLLYIGTKKQYPEVEHHTIVTSKDYRPLIDSIFKKKQLPEFPSMYVHRPTKTDTSMASKGKDSLYVLIPVPNLSANIDWEKAEDQFVDHCLDVLERYLMPDLRKNIEVLETFLPTDFAEQRNNYLGACWSIQPRLDQVAYFRPHNKSEEFKNLYLVGASVHPGAGVPGVILSAEATQKAIQEDFGL